MRGWDARSEVLFSYVNCERRVAKDHPLRAMLRIVDEALAVLSPEFEGLYAKFGRPSIPPERLLRGLLLQAFYSVRSERQLMEQLEYNLLFRWFVGLSWGLQATQSGGGVRMPCKGGGPGLDRIARRLEGLDGVLAVSSPRAVVLPDLRPSIRGRQSASVPRAAAARAAAWHTSSVSNFFIMGWGSAGCPVSASNTRIYPAVSILKHRAAAGEWIQSSARPY